MWRATGADTVRRKPSPQDWDTIRISGAAAWLSVKVEPDSVGKDEKARPRQRWVCRASADSAGLPFGEHVCEFRVNPTSNFGPSDPVKVSVTVTAPLVAVPDTLFFGTVRNGQPATATTDLMIRSGSPAETSSPVKVTHNMGDRLTLRLDCQSPSVWRLTATLNPSGAGMVRGEVSIALNRASLPGLKIPVVARISEKGP